MMGQCMRSGMGYGVNKCVYIISVRCCVLWGVWLGVILKGYSYLSLWPVGKPGDVYYVRFASALSTSAKSSARLATLVL